MHWLLNGHRYTLAALFPRKRPKYPLNRRLGGSQSNRRCCGEEKKTLFTRWELCLTCPTSCYSKGAILPLIWLRREQNATQNVCISRKLMEDMFVVTHLISSEIQAFCLEHLKGTECLEAWHITAVLKKWVVLTLTGFIWHRVDFTCWLLWSC
jgi:hypothetical protein